jgi:hypothetical protein
MRRILMQQPNIPSAARRTRPNRRHTLDSFANPPPPPPP